MGNVLKYCTKCEEGFAEKFKFCPNCAGELSEYQMTDDHGESANADETAADATAADATAVAKSEANPESNPDVEEAVKDTGSILGLGAIYSGAGESTIIDEAVEPLDTIAPVTETRSIDDIKEAIISDSANESAVEANSADSTVAATVASQESDMKVEASNSDRGESVEIIEDKSGIETPIEIEVEKKAQVPKVAASVASSVTTLFGTDGIPDYEDGNELILAETPKDYDDFGITQIDESGQNTRNRLLMGAAAVVLSITLTSFVWSVLNSPYFVAAIGNEELLAPLIEVAPLDLEEEKKEEADDESGGGGGGGKNEKTETSQGELPPQTRDPILIPPSTKTPRVKDPEIPAPNLTEGDIKRDRPDRTGIPTSLNTGRSDGTGSGGGIGSGRGTGVGSGRGTGEGSGIGSGSGSGNGDGTGAGNGRGNTRRRAVKPKVTGPTKPFTITSKPRPGYTDSARKNNVQGTVLLRVTFLANGRIGSVARIKGLPHGLTEKAIAAARRIRFTPAMRNGQGQTVTKRVSYTFTIY